jgi:predicted RND superfamily exporter protein
MKDKLTDFSTRNPWVIIFLVVVITAFFAAQLPKMKIDTDPENMLESHEPVRVFDHQVKEEFGLHDFIAVGVVNPSGVFTADQLQRIYAITEKITDIDGVIADDILAPSLVDDIRQGPGGSIVVEPLMGEAPQNDAKAQYILSRIKDNPILRGKLASDDGQAIALFIPIESKDMSHRIAGEIRAITDKYSDGEEFFIAGLPVAEDSFGTEMFSQMAFSAPLAGLIIFLLMLFFFRQLRIVLAPMIVAIASVIWTMGLLILTGNTVHIMSSMIPIFLIPIAVLNSIHIISEFHDRFQKYKHKITTIKHSIGELFVPMLFTSLTTIVGFLSLALTPIPPVRVFGIFVAIGIMFAWILSLTFNPAFAVLISDRALRNFGASEDKDSLLGRALHRIRGFSTHYAKPILLAAGVLVLVSALGLSLIKVNDNPVKWFKSSHPLRIADRQLNKHLAGTYMNYLVIDTDEDDGIKNPEVLNYIEGLQDHLQKNKIVGAVTGITDIVKKVRYEMFGGDKAYNSLPDNQPEVAQDLFIFEMSGGDPDDLFKFVTSDYRKANLWVQLTDGDNQSVAAVVNDAKDYMATNPPPVEMDANWAGLPYVNIAWQEKMVHGMRSSLLSSFLVVFLMMTALFRSLRWGIISMLPLSITIMAIYAFIGFIGKPYDMPVAVLSSLTLGLSIDFAIHYIQRSRSLYKRIGDFHNTMDAVFEGPARAISRNVLVIAIGFVPMFFSTLVPYITVGSFFFAIMLVSGAVTLILLPAISTVMSDKLYPPSHKTKKEKTATVHAS